MLRWPRSASRSRVAKNWRYELGFISGSALRILAAIVALGLAPVLMFWLYLGGSIGYRVRLRHADRAPQAGPPS